MKIFWIHPFILIRLDIARKFKIQKVIWNGKNWTNWTICQVNSVKSIVRIVGYFSNVEFLLTLYQMHIDKAHPYLRTFPTKCISHMNLYTMFFHCYERVFVSLSSLLRVYSTLARVWESDFLGCREWVLIFNWITECTFELFRVNPD